MLPSRGIIAYACACALLNYVQAVPASALAPSSTRNVPNSYENEPSCKHLTFTVSATATNKVIPSPAASNLSTQDGVNSFYAELPSLLAASTNQTRNGTYYLAAVYCQPLHHIKSTNSNHANAPLQILMHGSTYTKEYWNHGSWGFGDPKYSWTRAMNLASYATLTLDKLGNGASSHPDPVYDVQLPLQMETMHTLITQIKSGTSSIPIPSHYILVAHSSGSILAATLAQTHPQDIDALVLTGYPAGGANNKGGIPSYHYLPAAYNTSRFPPDLNYGYLLMNSEFNRTSAFYYANHYDPEIPHLDYLSSGSVPLGEGFNLGPQTQPAFKGKVLVVTGTKDPAICGFTLVDECVYNDTRVRAVNEAFANNGGFDYYMPESGHDLNWHFSAPTTYEVVVRKLGRLLGFEAGNYGSGSSA